MVNSLSLSTGLGLHLLVESSPGTVKQYAEGPGDEGDTTIRPSLHYRPPREL